MLLRNPVKMTQVPSLWHLSVCRGGKMFLLAAGHLLGCTCLHILSFPPTELCPILLISAALQIGTQIVIKPIKTKYNEFNARRDSCG